MSGCGGGCGGEGGSGASICTLALGGTLQESFVHWLWGTLSKSHVYIGSGGHSPGVICTLALGDTLQHAASMSRGMTNGNTLSQLHIMERQRSQFNQNCDKMVQTSNSSRQNGYTYVLTSNSKVTQK